MSYWFFSLSAPLSFASVFAILVSKQDSIWKYQGTRGDVIEVFLIWTGNNLLEVFQETQETSFLTTPFLILQWFLETLHT